MATWTAPEYHPAFEEYCETIFELAEDDLEVIQARIAERMGISRPAVSEMIRRMQDKGLLAPGRRIVLTDDGMALARQVVRRHRLAERFLTDVLGLSWAEAHAEAGKWEHVLSPRVEEAMSNLLGGPTTCPHGNPIPGSGYAAPESVALSEVEAGESFVVSRITEELEFVDGVLDFLEDSSICPGNSGVVTSSSPGGATTVTVDGAPVEIDRYTSERLLVVPVPAST
ncbi:MAG: metal-dependent transcriptional regulator [Acidimicrobiia bacterium]|nr:metal-dependent transcriptional regulator [Acidimicrobiia bacterium]MYJ14333.1 metal-dependent transcriptional regulator [Acidimicrobiia bacterium]